MANIKTSLGKKHLEARKIRPVKYGGKLVKETPKKDDKK